jgi:hypothetical protein
LGFAPVGIFREVGFKLGRWIDVGYWQLPLARCTRICSSRNQQREGTKRP